MAETSKNIIEIDLSMDDDDIVPNDVKKQEDANVEAETTETERSFIKFLSYCGLCKEHLGGRDAKFLPCLHTFCKPCLSIDSDVTTPLKCPTCSQIYVFTQLIDSGFVTPLANLQQQGIVTEASGTSAVAQSEDICTGCEENVPATSFCNECAEYLCDQCVQAHKRVKITKDHTIRAKGAVSGGSASAVERIMYCQEHKQEQLVLFCESCDLLTCRNCQLLRHKDHKYAFVDEASAVYKEQLSLIVSKIKEKKTYISNAKSLITRRHKEIVAKEEVVTKEIKSLAINLIKQVNQRGKYLLESLNSVCGAKKSQLEFKHEEIRGLAERLDHTMLFSEYLLKHGTGSDMLHSKRVLVSQLKSILKSRCEVPNPYHVVDIRFAHDLNYLTTLIAQQGTILVEGVPFYGNNHPASSLQQQQRTPPESRPSQSQRQQQQQQILQQHQYRNMSPYQQQQFMMQQRMRAAMGSSSPTSTMGGNAGHSSNHPRNPPTLQGPMHRNMPAHLGGPQSKHFTPPAQSSAISSSNHRMNGPQWNQQPGAHGSLPGQMSSHQRNMMQPPHTGNVPTSHKAMTNAMINLSQLQQQRSQRQHTPNMNDLSPIVIQPISPTSSNSSSQHLSNMAKLSAEVELCLANSISSTDAPLLPASLCNFSDPQSSTLSIKRELDADAQLLSTINFDADPVSFLQSIPGSMIGEIVPLRSEDTSYNSSTPGTVSNSSRRSSQSSNPPGRHTPNATSPQSVPPKSPALAAPTTNTTTPTSENKDTTPPLLSALTEDDNAIVQHIVDSCLTLGSPTLPEPIDICPQNANPESENNTANNDLPPPYPSDENSSTTQNGQTKNSETWPEDATSSASNERISATVEDSADTSTINTDTLHEISDSIKDLPSACNGASGGGNVDTVNDTAEKAKDPSSGEETLKAFDMIRQQMEKLDGVSVKEKSSTSHSESSDHSNTPHGVLHPIASQLLSNLARQNENKSPNQNETEGKNKASKRKYGVTINRLTNHYVLSHVPVVRLERLEDCKSPSASSKSPRPQCSTPIKGKDMYERPQDDPNEDWCAVCNNGGNLLCCENCPKVFHMACHIPQLMEPPSDKVTWQCRLCTPSKEKVLLDTDDLGTRKRKSSDNMTEEQLVLAERILLEMYSHRSSPPFQEPVSRSVENYHALVKKPMDMGTIRRKLYNQRHGITDSSTYGHIEEFLNDLKLIFTNCFMFNGTVSEVGKLGKTLEAKYLDLIEEYIPFYDPLLNPVSPAESLDSNYSTSSEREAELERRRAKRTKYADSNVHIK